MDTTRSRTTAGPRRHGRHAIRFVVGALLLTFSFGGGTALAHESREHRVAESTFTKWITTYPAMAGIVGGDVGAGAYSGEILGLAVTATGMVIDASYHFDGARHSFTALVRVVQTGFTDGSRAVITGRVTQGWLRGNQVRGGYTQIACGQAPSGTCFRGTLDILRGDRD
jgi:hypothetical protein